MENYKLHPYMPVGIGGGGGGGGNSLVDIGNHKYTNVQNCILWKYKCDKKNARRLPPPPPGSQNVPTALP